VLSCCLTQTHDHTALSATRTPQPLSAQRTLSIWAIWHHLRQQIALCTRSHLDNTTLRERTEVAVCNCRSVSDLTAQDLDILLDAVPVPFDFSLARRHLASHVKGENDEQNEESSLWWYPIFEACAKADIRRTLSALLPSDPVQNPPFPIGGAGGWKAEVRPRQSRARIWAERLEDAFGPGPLDRGLGRKPRRVAVSPFILYGWPLHRTD
jgi:hypothetical protein